MDKAINLALVGASGVVGQKIMSILEKRNINIDNFPVGISIIGKRWDDREILKLASAIDSQKP